MPAEFENSTKRLLTIAYAFLCVLVRKHADNQATLWALREKTLCVWVGSGVGQEMLFGEVGCL